MSTNRQQHGKPLITPSRPAGRLKVNGSLNEKLTECFNKYGEYRIIVTIRHTGTHSLKEQFPDHIQWHSTRQAFEAIASSPEQVRIIATFRDIERTAASWYNRGQLPFDIESDIATHRARWENEWLYYGKILRIVGYKTIYRMKDLKYKLYGYPDNGAHKALNDNNMSDYYFMVDKKLIDYAKRQMTGI